MNNATNELVFDGLRVPTENLIGGEGESSRYIQLYGYLSF
jgi:alkylation response protein AidB-like acyl-CoA dehydrogenase